MLQKPYTPLWFRRKSYIPTHMHVSSHSIYSSILMSQRPRSRSSRLYWSLTQTRQCTTYYASRPVNIAHPSKYLTTITTTTVIIWTTEFSKTTCKIIGYGVTANIIASHAKSRDSSGFDSPYPKKGRVYFFAVVLNNINIVTVESHFRILFTVRIFGFSLSVLHLR